MRIDHRMIYWSQYAALRVWVTLLVLLPRFVRLCLGAGLGRFCYAVGFYRKVVDKNMDLVAFWGKDEQQGIAKRLYINMGMYLLDALQTPKVSLCGEVKNLNLLMPREGETQGVIAIFAHYGNWELLTDLMASKVENHLCVIAKPMRNPFVDKWLRCKRSQRGITVISPQKAMRPMLRALRQGKVVALAVDQYAGSMGTSVDFLGKSTRTVRTAAGLALHTGCRVVAVHAVMQPDATYKVTIRPASDVRDIPTATDDAVTELQRRHNQMISEWIRQQPTHWFGWFHRRFKDIVEYSK